MRVRGSLTFHQTRWCGACSTAIWHISSTSSRRPRREKSVRKCVHTSGSSQLLSSARDSVFRAASKHSVGGLQKEKSRGQDGRRGPRGRVRRDGRTVAYVSPWWRYLKASLIHSCVSSGLSDTLLSSLQMSSVSLAK